MQAIRFIKSNIMPKHIISELYREDTECVVCIQRIPSSDELHVTKCGHKYCKTCYYSICSQPCPRCSICRTQFEIMPEYLPAVRFELSDPRVVVDETRIVWLGVSDVTVCQYCEVHGEKPKKDTCLKKKCPKWTIQYKFKAKFKTPMTDNAHYMLHWNETRALNSPVYSPWQAISQDTLQLTGRSDTYLGDVDWGNPDILPEMVHHMQEVTGFKLVYLRFQLTDS